MDREVVFRGLTKQGKWLFGDLNHIDGKVYIYDRSENGGLDSPDSYEVIPETVGQFTGLRDKKGVRIFEGDLAQHNAWSYPFEVIYDKARFVCKLRTGITQYIDHMSLEVIGNIHENK